MKAQHAKYQKDVSGRIDNLESMLEEIGTYIAKMKEENGRTSGGRDTDFRRMDSD